MATPIVEPRIMAPITRWWVKRRPDQAQRVRWQRNPGRLDRRERRRRQACTENCPKEWGEMKMIGYLRFLRVHKLFLIILAGGAGLALAVRAGTFDPNLQDFPDPTGAVRTVSTTGSVDTANPFFQSLGTNGRACITCHQPCDAWTVTPPHIQERFAASSGEDPIFRPVDGANCPSADVSTEEAREQAYSMLLNKGLIRVSLAVPGNAEFEV